MANEGAEPSATQAIRDTQTATESLATLMPRYLLAVERIAGREYRLHLNDTLGEATADALLNDPAWPQVAGALNPATAAGWHPLRLLDLATDDIPRPRDHHHHHRRHQLKNQHAGEGEGGASLWRDTPTFPTPAHATAPTYVPEVIEAAPPTGAEVLADRITTLTTGHYPPGPMDEPTRADADRYARLIGVLTGQRLDPRRGPDPATTPARP